MFKVGDVVFLKSGGTMMTVAGVEDDEITVIWMGEEGDLFREEVPAAVLMHADQDDAEAEEDEAEEGEEEEEEEDEEPKKKKKKKG